jgi:hypothetical protein
MFSLQKFAAITFACLFIIFPIEAMAVPVISVGNYEGNFSDDVDVPIDMSGAEDIGRLNLSLGYDPAVLRLNDVDPGTFTGGSTVEFNPETSSVDIGIADEAGISGDGSLATLNFDVIGYPGDWSPLTIAGTAYNVSTFNETPTETENGNFTVTGEMNNITLSLTLPDISADYGETVLVPLTLSAPLPVGSMDISLTYDPAIIRLNATQEGSLISGSSLFAVNTATEGTIALSAADTEGFEGTGTLAVLEFGTWGDYNQVSPLSFLTAC